MLFSCLPTNELTRPKSLYPTISINPKVQVSETGGGAAVRNVLSAAPLNWAGRGQTLLSPAPTSFFQLKTTQVTWPAWAGGAVWWVW